MTQPILVQSFLGRLLAGVTRARGALFVLPEGVWTVSTLTSALRNVYVCPAHTPGALGRVMSGWVYPSLDATPSEFGAGLPVSEPKSLATAGTVSDSRNS